MLFFQKRESDNLKFSFKISGIFFQLLQYSEDVIDLRVENQRFFDLMQLEKTGKLKKMKEEYNKKKELDEYIFNLNNNLNFRYNYFNKVK